jgi:hypothetical protein
MGFIKYKIIPCFLISVLFLLTVNVIPAQEALLSTEEQYYDFLALQGITYRPTLNYRTLSDSVWVITKDPHLWQTHKLESIYNPWEKIVLRIYGPDLFMSFNTTSPYGQNDGALWQGRGFNSSITAGIRLESFGLELTFKPQITFSQNLSFELIKPRDMTGEKYAEKSDQYGYFWGTVDAPQRFGNQPFFVYDWGDSEIRYTWKTFTIGFGTQSIWLGPSYLNSILHSNNAPTYPKFDIGLRKQKIIMPWLGWYLGEFESRLWIGRLSESEYFDNDDSNNHNMFHGLALAYAPPFFRGLTLFVNRVCLVPWEWENLRFILPKNVNTTEDQKASFGFSWIFPQVGFEVYGEIGVDDYTVGSNWKIIRHPFHTTVYTGGLRKSFLITPTIQGELLFEFNWMEMTQDFQFQWPYSFYFHHFIKQGYTNEGQWIGAGSGWGGNSQHLEFRLYFTKGFSSLFIQRSNPDNNFLYAQAIEDVANNGELSIKLYRTFKALFAIGLSSSYYITPNLNITGSFAYNPVINPLYENDKDRMDIVKHNFVFQVRAKYTF